MKRFCPCGTLLVYEASIRKGYCDNCRAWMAYKSATDGSPEPEKTVPFEQYSGNLGNNLNPFSPLNKPSETKVDSIESIVADTLKKLGPVKFSEVTSDLSSEKFRGILPPDADPLPGHPEFHRIIGEMQALHAKKAADYGLSADVLANCRGSIDFGIPAWIGVVMRMNDKMTRLKSFAQKGTLANESVEDSLLDIACYAIIALILYREQSQEGGSK